MQHDYVISSWQQYVCRLLQMTILVLIVLGVVYPTFAQPFTHPGIPLTRADLEAVKAKVLAGEQPWKTGYDALAADWRSQLSYTMRGPFKQVSRNPHIDLNPWRHDMIAIWNLTRMWYFTGDARYARKARDIPIAWAQTQESFNGMEASLDLGDYAYRWAGGAEILRCTWPGWMRADTAKVKALFGNVYQPLKHLNVHTLGPNNKGGLTLAAALAAAVFNDDRAMFNQAVRFLRVDLRLLRGPHSL